MDGNKYYHSQFLAPKLERSEYLPLQKIIPTFVSKKSTLLPEDVQNLSNKNCLIGHESNYKFTLNYPKSTFPVLLTTTRPSTSSQRSQTFDFFKKNKEKNKIQSTDNKNNTIVDDDFFSCLPKRRRSGNIVQSDLAENCQHEQFEWFNSRRLCTHCGKTLRFF